MHCMKLGNTHPTASTASARRKVPFDFAQGRLSPGCRRAQDDIGLDNFEIEPLPLFRAELNHAATSSIILSGFRLSELQSNVTVGS
jgi:hypothetical protein